MKKTQRKKWLWGILGAFAALLIIAIIIVYLYFASWTLNYVNGVLADIPNYPGSVESVNLDVLHGAYRADRLVINKKGGAIPTPFVAIDRVYFSIQWSALLHGHIVSDITLAHPVINFAVNKSASQTGAETDWTKPIKKLIPIDINHVTFEDGKITYQDFSSKPEVNIFIDNMSGEIQNLRNVEDKDHPLPSTLDIKGTSIGDGSLKIHGRLNILKQIPDMNLLLALENVNLTALNNYSEAYAAFDFKSGIFNLFSQIVVKDSQISGYVKPMLTNLSVDVLKNANPVEIVWDTAVAGVLKLFTNLPKDQFATKIDLEGSLKNPNVNIWTTLGGIFRNAFISAMSKGFDSTGENGLIKPPESKQQ